MLASLCCKICLLRVINLLGKLCVTLSLMRICCCSSYLYPNAGWYIQASKARLYHSGGGLVASVAQAVLLYVFENILKLLDPFMPFVTEALWQANQQHHYKFPLI